MKSIRLGLLGGAVSVLITSATAAFGQGLPPLPARQGNYNISARPAEDIALPNPYWLDETFFKWPKGRPVGSTSAIDMDRDGKSIWVFERCGTLNSCIGSTVNPIMKFDSTGKMVKEFGAGLFTYPHGMYVDFENNIWVADLQSNKDRPAPPGGVSPPPAAANIPPLGAVVRKFNQDGKLLLTIGTPGVMGNDETHLSQPSDVAVSREGFVFVADGHDSQPSNARIAKFDRNGKFVKAWSACGRLPADTLDCQHSIAIDSKGRLFVANRGNNRISIFDQEGVLLDEWYQFGRPSGLFIDKNDILYAADSESDVMQHNAYVRGVHVGSAVTGKVTAFIPDPQGNPTAWMPAGTTNGSEGVAVASDGTMYIAKVLPAQFTRYVLKPADQR
jgi:DNA-binding beta-propeller fold protein YncE